MNTLALVMIARDEARCIGRALASVRPLVDQMLVLDTGSRDDTAALATAAGARVEHWPWRDDFAAARNAALDCVDADWLLVLDADEWFCDSVEAVKALAALRHGPAGFIGLLRVDSAFEGAGAGHGAGAAALAPSWLPRLLPRGVRYTGRVHEQPQSALPRRRLPVTIGHDGYMAAQAGLKRGRNEALLREALAAAPADAYLHYQLGKELEVQQRFAEAAPCYREANSEATEAARGDAKNAGGALAGWRHDLIVRLIYTLKMTREFEPALQLAEHELPHWQHSPDFFFALGDLLLDWAATEPSRAAELLPMIESCWLRAIDIGEQPALQDSVSGRGSHLAAHNLAVFHASLGDAEQARFWRGREQVLRAGIADASATAPTTAICDAGIAPLATG